MKNYYLKKDDIYSYFIKFQNNPNLQNYYQLIRFYDCFKININKIIINNLSILHIRQNIETMKLIIQKGGNINNPNKMNITPIMLQYDYDIIIRLYS